jgi:LysM repeat protein
MRLRALLIVLFITLLPIPAQAAGYVVRPGDSLGTIAVRFHVSLRALAQANGIRNVNLVQVGRVLVIPTPMRRLSYRVQWGDSLLGIAARYGITIGTIRSLNPALGAYPLAGQILRLCSPCGGTSTSVVPTSALGRGGATTASGYTVQPGDSLSAIALRYGTTTYSLMTANRLTDPNLIRIGMRLTVTGSGSVARSTGIYDPYQAKALIVTYARLYGVDPSLALAIGWNESGFNENLISSTGAIGVMQVEPYTGTHVSNLLGRRLNLYNVQDNVQAGVYYFSRLLTYYSGNERLATAAYYQGWRSLAARGWFTDTVQYVRTIMALRAQFG